MPEMMGDRSVIQLHQDVSWAWKMTPARNSPSKDFSSISGLSHGIRMSSKRESFRKRKCRLTSISHVLGDFNGSRGGGEGGRWNDLSWQT